MRLFIAIDSPKEVQEYCISLQNQLDNNLARFRASSSFHLTLKFLGDVRNSSVIKSLEPIRFTRFSLTTNTMGVFPNKHNIRIIWLGLKHSPELDKLHETINKYLSLEDDLKFHPHITLARVSGVLDKSFINNIEKISCEEHSFDVDRFILYESLLTPNGLIYNKIREF
jgi:2'-5' RNA ligase